MSDRILEYSPEIDKKLERVIPTVLGVKIDLFFVYLSIFFMKI